MAVSYLVANAVSNGVFAVGLPTFLGLSDNFDGGYSSRNDSNEITARELWDIATGGAGGISSRTFPEGLPQAIQSNLRRNWLNMGIQVIGIPIVAKVATKVLRKPVLTPANRMLKQVGLSDVKV